MIEQIRHQSLLVGIDNNSICSNEIKLRHKEVKMTTILKIEPAKYDYYEDIALLRVDKKTHKTEYIFDDETEWKPTETDIEKIYNDIYKRHLKT